MPKSVIGREIPGVGKLSRAGAGRTLDEKLRETLAWLKRQGRKGVKAGMARYGIPSDRAFGIPVGTLKQKAKAIGRDHALAGALWESGWYEARLLASFLDDPAKVSSTQMDRWCRDFDNWAVCDTACFALFDRTRFAWRKVDLWCPRQSEFVRRAGFALLASLTVHDKTAADEPYLRGLAFVERAAADERNFVKKAVNWALRSIGKRNAPLNVAAVEVARRLADSREPAASWVGKDALRELTNPAVLKRIAGRRRAT